jgi:hypothetical protein
LTAMHPDSGVPPEDARNSLPNEIEQSVYCDELWYSTSRCQPRFDPAAANAMLAELINLINKGEVVYDCTRLDQVQLAVRYLIQRGLNTGAIAVAGPTNYYTTLDPPVTRYNDFMVLCMIPRDSNNAGPITLNCNDQGPRPVLRCDGKQLEKNDWQINRPYLIGYWQGNWYVLRMVDSQIPKVMTSDIDGWIRTDGNDATGDGTANSPDKAFRTIQGCWTEFTRRYLPSPFYTIHMRLGIPGTYESAALGPFGGKVALHGDLGNRQGYRIANGGNVPSQCLLITGMNLNIEGVTLVNSMSSPDPTHLHIDASSHVLCMNVNFECSGSSGRGKFVNVTYNSSLGFSGNFDYIGNGASIVCAFLLYRLGTIYGAAGQVTETYTNMNFVGAYAIVDALSTFAVDPSGSFSHSGCTGPKYFITANGTMQVYGRDPPGNAAGTAQYGGQYIP